MDQGSASVKTCIRCAKIKAESEFCRDFRSGKICAYCRECYLRRNRESYHRNKHKNRAEKNERSKWNKLKAAYGIHQEEYAELLASQDGVCAICQEFRLQKGRTKMPVDHNHITGEVRGILCHACNVLLGYAREDVNLLAAAINYLKRYNNNGESN